MEGVHKAGAAAVCGGARFPRAGGAAAFRSGTALFRPPLPVCRGGAVRASIVLECAARRGQPRGGVGQAGRCSLLLAARLCPSLPRWRQWSFAARLRTKTDEPVSAVIVLGAGVNGETPSLTLRTRIDAAAAYLARSTPTCRWSSPADRGRARPSPRPSVCAARWCAAAWTRARLYPEERSTSTQENLRYSRAILEELGVDPARRVAIVTSDLPPLPRAADVGRAIPPPCRRICLPRSTFNA